MVNMTNNLLGNEEVREEINNACVLKTGMLYLSLTRTDCKGEHLSEKAHRLYRKIRGIMPFLKSAPKGADFFI